MGFTQNAKLFGICVWIVAVLSGYAWLTAHQFEATLTPLPPLVYPAIAPPPTPGRATLLMFVHPKCPCTQASLERLASILGDTGQAMSAWVLFCCPKGAPPDWCAGANWDRATAMPGVHVQLDEAGKMARLFEAATSGHTVLYNQDERLRFSGGITSERGHAGASAGSEAVLDAVRGKATMVRAMPVFGCALFDRETSEESGA